MMVGIAVVLVAGSIGTLVGVLAGYMGGAVDSLLMRLTDAVLSIPYTLIAMCLSVILGQSSGTVVFVLGITCWSNYAKVVRVETMSLKQQEFVTLAKLAGASQDSDPVPAHSAEPLEHDHRYGDSSVGHGDHPLVFSELFGPGSDASHP